jgi:hypothetical protein
MVDYVLHAFRLSGQPPILFSRFQVSGFPVGLNHSADAAGSAAPAPFFNLRHVRIMHDNLHHAVTQRIHLLSDYFQPRFPTVALFWRFTHFKLIFLIATS